VEGFPPSMVPYDHLSEDEIGSLIEYIKSLSDAAPPEGQESGSENQESEPTEQESGSDESASVNNTADTAVTQVTMEKKSRTQP